MYTDFLFQQKNPSTIRIPEEDRGKENFTMTSWVTLERSSSISRHIASLCAEASDSTYARDVDLRAWAELPGRILSGVVILFRYYSRSPRRCGI
uniref:Out at first protein BRICHOS-like domain-containing protein n=1 Tax=Phlebotomus papatasi TaxID=29031 RepID=A0A1B0GMV4_PHLPP